MGWWNRPEPNAPKLQRSSTPIHMHSNTPFLVRFHISGMIEKGSTELINITSAGLTLIVQKDVFRHAPYIVAMVGKVIRALVGPVSVIEHKCVHRNHDDELGGA